MSCCFCSWCFFENHITMRDAYRCFPSRPPPETTNSCHRRTCRSGQGHLPSRGWNNVGTFKARCVQWFLLLQSKKEEGYQKNPEESGRIQKNPEESRRIRKNPEKSRRIRKNPEESGRIRDCLPAMIHQATDINVGSTVQVCQNRPTQLGLCRPTKTAKQNLF